ncbi:MAG: AlpA family phage regulatory protein [Chromatiaceae bacterium]|nr:AlpA family phage regulatory protein [Chromatiaceae bacterium]
MAAIVTTETSTETRFLRMSEVLTKTGIRSRSTVYELMRAGSFPSCVFLTQKAIGFVEKEIEEWMRARIAARPAPTVMSSAPPRPRQRRIVTTPPTATPAPTTATPPPPRRRGPARPRAARPVIG